MSQLAADAGTVTHISMMVVPLLAFHVCNTKKTQDPAQKLDSAPTPMSLERFVHAFHEM
jgi:hypothetical protein